MSEDRTKTPSEADLQLLPRFARIAFAARCARRAQPRYQEWEWASKESIDALENAISFVEYVAAKADTSTNNTLEVERITRGVSRAIPPAQTTAAVSTDAGREAYFSAQAARAAATFDAANAALQAQSAHVDVVTMWNDFDRLHELSVAENWTDETPVDVARLGPMWPDATMSELVKFERLVTDNGVVCREPTKSAPVDLFFSAAEYSADDMATVLAGMSAMYTQLTGDELAARR